MASRRIGILIFKFIASKGKMPDISWIDEDLCISSSLRDSHYPNLAGLGIKAIVDLRKEGKDNESLLTEYGIKFLHLPVANHSAPTKSQMTHGTNWVLTQTNTGLKTLIHCKEGVGRSVVLACCVMMKKGYGLREALQLIRSRRWGTSLTKTQLDALKIMVTG